MLIRTRGVHDAADNEAADSAAGEMQSWALLHAGVLDQLSLGQEIRGQLNRGAEASSNHGRRDAAVQAKEALAAIDLSQSIPGIPVVVLSAHGPHGREALQTGLDEEKGTASSRTEDSGRGASKDVDAQVLRVLVLEEQLGERLSDGLVEAEAAAVEEHLIDVGGAQTPVYALDALVLDDGADAVDGPAIVLRLGAFGLQLALQLLSDLEHFGRVSDCDGSASRKSACGETAVRIRIMLAKGRRIARTNCKDRTQPQNSGATRKPAMEKSCPRANLPYGGRHDLVSLFASRAAVGLYRDELAKGFRFCFSRESLMAG